MKGSKESRASAHMTLSKEHENKNPASTKTHNVGKLCTNMYVSQQRLGKVVGVTGMGKQADGGQEK